MHVDSLGFTVVARVVAAETRRLGLHPPGFRSPPRRRDATRTIRRSGDVAIVAVVVRGRPLADVVADLIEGVIVANGLTGQAAVRCRRRLALAVDSVQRPAGHGHPPAAGSPSRPSVPAASVKRGVASHQARVA